MMENRIGNDWDEVLEGEFEKEYYKKLEIFLKEAYNKGSIYPEREHIFSAFRATCFEDTRVVILGQDPYHGYNQAHGMAFSVQPQVAIPPSLHNIFKELHRSLGCVYPNNGYLAPWAEQGVLLLNTVLTVCEGQAGSHKNQGWEVFTDAVLRLLSEKEEQVIFLLWGTPAKKKKVLIDETKHKILESVHPSPLSAYRGFIGNDHFKKVNELLGERNEVCIDWQIPHR